MNDLQSVLADAERIAKSANGAAPAFNASDYEQAALDVAAAEQREGEGVASAFARLAHEGDERVTALLKAAQRAELIADQGEQLRKQAIFDALLDEIAKHARRADETDEQVRARLMRENEAVRGGYAAAYG